MGSISGMDALYLTCGFNGHSFMYSPAIDKLMRRNCVSSDRIEGEVYTISQNR
jgi:hypothetical protein